MKQKLLFLSLLSSKLLFSQIIYTDTTDFLFENDNSTTIDFNQDGTAEFTLEDAPFSDAIVSYDIDDTTTTPNGRNFITVGTIDTGNWEIIDALPEGFIVDASGNYEAQFDAYINADWADTTDKFPEGTSYIGVRFILDTNTHFGWIRVSSDANGNITLLDYAYNSTPNAAITTGQGTTLSTDNFQLNEINLNVFPNPSNGILNINTNANFTKAYIINTVGQKITASINNNLINLPLVANGIYTLVLENNKQISTKKIIIKRY